MPVRDHTYYLAQEDKVLGPRQDLADFLRETYRRHVATDTGASPASPAEPLEPSRVEGASVWWNGDIRHVAVTYRARSEDGGERAATVKLEPA